MKLNKNNLVIYAAKHYYNPTHIDGEEFFDDLKRFKYVKRLVNRYQTNGDLAERLILNHLIVIFNVFGVEAGLRMLEFKIPSESDWSIIKPFLIYLRHIENTKYASTPMDPRIVEELRKI